jgi:hypothetical protein
VTADFTPQRIPYSIANFRAIDGRDLMLYAVLRRNDDAPFRTPFDGMFAARTVSAMPLVPGRPTFWRASSSPTSRRAGRTSSRDHHPSTDARSSSWSENFHRKASIQKRISDTEDVTPTQARPIVESQTLAALLWLRHRGSQPGAS